MPLHITGGAPFSNAGVKSTSLGMIPLFSKLIIPLLMSSSVIGGGSSGPNAYAFFDFHLFALYIPPNDLLAVYACLPDPFPFFYIIPVPFDCRLSCIIPFPVIARSPVP